MKTIKPIDAVLKNARVESNPVIYGYTLSQWEGMLGRKPTPFLIEAACYKNHVLGTLPPDWSAHCKLKRSDHLKRGLFEYHAQYNPTWDSKTSWYIGADRMVQAFCGEAPDGFVGKLEPFDVIAVPAASNAMKTFIMVQIVMFHYICFPERTVVSFTSVSEAKLRKDIWANAVWWLKLAPEIAADYDIHSSVADKSIVWKNTAGLPTKSPLARCAVYGVAVARGDSQAVSKVSGTRNLHVIVMVDEADTAEPTLATTADSNLRSGTDFFRLIMLGNPSEPTNAFGKYYEPPGGHNDEPPEAPCMISKLGAMVININSLRDNPNITCNPDIDVDMPVICPFLQKREDLRTIIRRFGLNSRQWYQFVVGWPAPSSVESRLLNRMHINMGFNRPAFEFI